MSGMGLQALAWLIKRLEKNTFPGKRLALMRGNFSGF
jgi:hypothetical protein